MAFIRPFIVLCACGLLSAAQAQDFSHTGRKAEKVWNVPGNRSLNMEFRFPKSGKGDISLQRLSGDESGRISNFFTILPAYCRPSVFSGTAGKVTGYPNRFWRDLGLYDGLKPDHWYRIRLCSSENDMALLIEHENVWKEIAFLPFSGTTKELGMTLNGEVEIRNFSESPEAGKKPLYSLNGAEGKSVAAKFVSGHGAATLYLVFRDGSEKMIQCVPASDYASVPEQEEKKTGRVQREIPDAYLRMDGLNIKHFIRPDYRFYEPQKKMERIKEFLAMPPASGHETEFRFTPGGDGTEIWLDGRFAGLFAGKELSKLSLRLPADGRLIRLDSEEMVREKRFLPLEIRTQNQVEKAKAELKEKLPFGMKEDGAFLRIARHAEFTEPQQELDPYLSRSAFTGMPESFLYSVPLRQYYRAHILAALDPDPEKSPVLTARLTRYRLGGVGDAVADAELNLAEAPHRSVGKVTVDGRELDLCLYEVTLPVGEIQDYIFFRKGKLGALGSPYLNFELLGPRGKAGILWDFSRKPAKRKSGALVFGTVLEVSPAEMELEQSVAGLIFADSEARRTTVRVKAADAGKYFLKSAISGIDGKSIREKSFELTLKDGEEVRKELDLSVPAEGYYDLSLELREASGRALVLHRAAFADLGRDTRRAGLDSPYSAWWFGVNHNGTADPKIGGGMLKKAGVRRFTAGFLNTNERALAPWKLTLTQIPWYHDIVSKKIPLAEKLKLYEERVRATVAAYPSCKSALIFHESYGGPVPPQLYGGAPLTLPENKHRAAKQLFEIGTALARMYREKFPGIKLVMGNSASSTAIVDAMFQLKFPKELFDFLGSESVGRFCLPELFLESGGPHGAWFLRELGRIYGYPQPVTACYEWVGHIDRELTREERAQWLVRDTLLAHAYGFDNIPLLGLYDVEDSYFNTQWGGGGSCRRYPLLYPKPVYVAASVLTRELDCAKFVRRVPTGSLTVYAMEFARDNGEFVYPLWLPRGRAELAVEFDSPPRARAAGLYGAPGAMRADGSTLYVTASESPLYLTVSQKVKRIGIVRRDTPAAVAPRNVQLVDPLRSVAGVVLLEGGDGRLASPWRTPGRFVLRDAEDSLELELLPAQGKTVPRTVSEYVNIALRRPVPLKGEPSSVGIEVYGNSSWARIFFILVDVKGQTFISSGAGYGTDGRGLSRVNFDGWGSIQFPFSSTSRVRLSEVNTAGGVWKSDGDGVPAYPVRVTGLAVEMPRYAADLDRLVPVGANKIRFRNLTVFE